MLSKFVETLTYRDMIFYRDMILPSAKVILTRFPTQYLYCDVIDFTSLYKQMGRLPSIAACGCSSIIQRSQQRVIVFYIVHARFPKGFRKKSASLSFLRNAAALA